MRLARAEIAARHPVLVFVALALGWSWSSLLAGRALGGSAGDALQIAAQVGPSLAGLAAAFLCGGRAQLRGLASQALRWRVEPYWYAVALFGPVLLWWVAFAYIAAVQPYSPVSTGEFLAFFPLFALQLALGGGLGEELGWRGFLQSALERGRGVVTASLAVAAVWALWGAPAFLLEGERNAGVGAFLWFAGLCAAYSLIFARVLHGARGSVWIVALLHASANVAEPTWRGVVPSLGGSQAVALVHAAYVLFLALVAVFLRFGPEPRPESA